MDLSAPLFYEGEFPIGTAGSLKPGCAVAKRQLEQAMAAQVEASDHTAAPRSHTLRRSSPRRRRPRTRAAVVLTLLVRGADRGPALQLY